MHRKKVISFLSACTLAVLSVGNIVCGENITVYETLEGPGEPGPEGTGELAETETLPPVETEQRPEQWTEQYMTENPEELQQWTEPYYEENYGTFYGEGSYEIPDGQIELWDEREAAYESHREGSINRNTEKEYQIEDFDIPDAEDAKRDFQLPDMTEIPDQMYLKVPEILQRPELPTGCEAVSLTMALQYEEFDVDKLTIASDFLIYNKETDNMAVGYVGDPFSEDGAGCFAPAIAATADAFFADQKISYQAYDITETEFEELFAYIAAGTPVILWTTMYMAEPEFTREDAEYNGRIYRWYRQEHCVVLSGYNLEERTVQINDPLEGIIDRSMDDFASIYNRTGQNAVVLREKEEGASAAGQWENATNTEVGIN